MCAPNLPSPDHYDTNYQVKPHFAPTPGLTTIPVTHFYFPLSTTVKAEVAKLIYRHGLRLCPTYGLYFAGSKHWTSLPDRDKIMLLVIELHHDQIDRWRDIDAEARALLRTYGLSGKHGVCVRYYKHLPHLADDSDRETYMASPSSAADEDDASDTEAAAIDPVPPTQPGSLRLTSPPVPSAPPSYSPRSLEPRMDDRTAAMRAMVAMFSVPPERTPGAELAANIRNHARSSSSSQPETTSVRRPTSSPVWRPLAHAPERPASQALPRAVRRAVRAQRQRRDALPAPDSLPGMLRD